MKEDAQLNNLDALNEKYSIRNGIAQAIALNGSNSYFSLFAISVLSVTNYQVGLINSLPQFMGMFGMLIGSMILNRLTEKKTFTAFAFLITRLFLLAVIFVVYLPSSYAGWIFVLLIGFMNIPGAFATLSWQSLIGEMISDVRRNTFFSLRNKLLTFVGMTFTVIIGIFLSFFAENNPFPYQSIFLVAFFAGLVEVYYLFRHIEKKKDIRNSKKSYKINFSAFSHKPFVVFLVCGLLFNFTWQMAWSLFSIYQIKYAGATGVWISAISVTSLIGQIISYKWWGRMADKYGNHLMMIPVSIGMATAPVLNILSTNLIYLTVINALAGLFISGTVLLLFNLLLEVTTDENRDSCISNYNILLAIIGFIAPQIGVFLLEKYSMNTAMIISTIARLLSGGSFFFLYVFLQKRPTNSVMISEKSGTS